MKKTACLLLVVCICCIFVCSFAEYTPSYMNDKITREYKYDNSGIFPMLVIQEGDLDEDVLCHTIREIIKADISSKNETIEEIWIDKDAVLYIVLDWEPGYCKKYSITDADLADMRFTDITDDLLKYPDIDQFWDKILFDCPGGTGLFTKDMIVDSEFGRYFDGQYIYAAFY